MRVKILLILAFLLGTAATGFSQTAADLVTKAKAEIEQKEYDGAIADLTQAIKLEKKDAMAFALRGDAYLQKKQVELARADYEKAIKLEPKNSEFYYKRGLSFKEAPGDSIALIMADLGKAIELDPTNENALRERGLRYYLTFKPEDRPLALADLERAVKIDSLDVAAWGPLARVYVQMNNAEKALEAYETYIALKPEDPYAYVERGHIYEFQKKYDLAIEDYTETIKILPNDVIGYGNRADAYLKAKMPRLALADYNKGVELRPNDSSSYSQRGQVLEAQGKFDLAVKDYRKALEIDKYNAVAKGNLQGAIEKHNAAVGTYEKLAPEFNKLVEAYNIPAVELDKKLFTEFEALDKAQKKLANRDSKVMCAKLVDIRDLLKQANAAFAPMVAMYEQGRLAGFTQQLEFVENAHDGLADAGIYVKGYSSDYKCET